MRFEEFELSGQGPTRQRVTSAAKMISAVAAGDKIFVTMLDSKEYPKNRIVEVYAFTKGDEADDDLLLSLTFLHTETIVIGGHASVFNVYYKFV